VLAACGDDATETTPGPSPVELGAERYATYCALCHGEEAEGYAADQASAIGNQDFLAIADDDFLRSAIARGRPGTVMSAWGSERGGPLAAEDVDAIVAFLRSRQTAASIDVDAISVPPGEPMRGEAVWSVYCSDCHGATGEGADYLSVANPEFLAAASDGYLLHVIENGRTGTDMLPFDTELTSQNIADVVALIRSWQMPVDPDPCGTPVRDFASALLHPEGDAPDFPAGRFVPVADVFAAYDSGARMLLFDARAPCDYVEEHIAGAVSVPFYEVASYVEQIPQGETIVTYCACPHAEAEAAADALEAAGFADVKVLDEGLPLWIEEGHPLTSGTAPGSPP
jgi:cytochrome c oxidase cbb3-type subunit 3